MVQINFALREVNVKVVYYGPGRSGKTTNLEIIHSKAPKGSIGDMMSIATETDRTLFFDFLPLDLGKVAGMNTKFQLYTVPGQVYYKATRKLVLQGADGIVWVADSQREMHEENLQSLADLEENLAENGLNIGDLPLILQYNKRDLDNLMTVDEMNAAYNRWGAPSFEAVAVNGDGVFPTLKSLASAIIQKLNQEHGYAGQDATPARAPAAAAPPPAPEKPVSTGNAAQDLAAELEGTPAAPPAPPPAEPVALPPAPVASAPPPAEPALIAEPAAAPAGFMSSAPPPPPPPPTPEPAPAAAPVPPPVAEPPRAAVPPPAATAAPAPPPPVVTSPPVAPAARVEQAPPPPVGEGVPAGTVAPSQQDSGDARVDTDDLNPVSREIRRRREEASQKRQRDIERIKASGSKPLKQESKTSPMVYVVGGVIIVAVMAIVYFVFLNK